MQGFVSADRKRAEKMEEEIQERIRKAARLYRTFLKKKKEVSRKAKLTGLILVYESESWAISKSMKSKNHAVGTKYFRGVIG